uniref:Uncharacterized protein n=1 Tax=Panagrolaimus sp. PS1159 TaxID=55785 RepID=A0AC35G2P6_9BILA
MNDDGSIVPFEKLIQVLPKIKEFSFTCHGASPKLSIITTRTVNELLKFPHFFKIEEFELWDIPEQFDIKTFFNFLKKNKITKSSLYFSRLISEAYKILLETIVDEIVETENHNWLIPNIHFAGIDEDKHRKLFLLSL